MTDIKIVSGLNYGDESKGLVANAVSTSKSLTIMSSNSCQRAHTVEENGIRRVFRHFGSGTLRGAATYFTDKFLVNPAMFREEYEELVALGIKPEVYVRSSSIIVDVMDMFANVQIEEARGDLSHSSTGCGVWEAICRHRRLQNIALENGMNTYKTKDQIEYYKNRLREHNAYDKNAEEFFNGKYLIENISDDFAFFYQHVNIIQDVEDERELLNSYPLLVFENGQGLLLTDEYMFDPDHNTPAYVGASDPARIIRKYFDNDEVNIEALYVSRTYYTRHGKGQIGVYSNCECDKADINPDMVDLTNIPNPNQGTLRYGKFNDKDAAAAITRAIVDSDIHSSMNNLVIKPSVVITHTNEFNDGLLEGIAMRNNCGVYTSDNHTTIKKVKEI